MAIQRVDEKVLSKLLPSDPNVYLAHAEARWDSSIDRLRSLLPQLDTLREDLAEAKALEESLYKYMCMRTLNHAGEKAPRSEAEVPSFEPVFVTNLRTVLNSESFQLFQQSSLKALGSNDHTNQPSVPDQEASSKSDTQLISNNDQCGQKLQRLGNAELQPNETQNASTKAAKPHPIVPASQQVKPVQNKRQVTSSEPSTGQSPTKRSRRTHSSEANAQIATTNTTVREAHFFWVDGKHHAFTHSELGDGFFVLLCDAPDKDPYQFREYPFDGGRAIRHFQTRDDTCHGAFQPAPETEAEILQRFSWKVVGASPEDIDASNKMLRDEEVARSVGRGGNTKAGRPGIRMISRKGNGYSVLDYDDDDDEYEPVVSDI